MQRKIRNRLTALLFAGLLCACHATPQTDSLDRDWPELLADSSTIDELPFFPQEQYQCGPAALATVLNASGLAVLPEDLVSQVYVPGRRGSFQAEMAATARTRGRIAYQLQPHLSVLFREVSAGNPVLVLQNLGLESLPKWHFAVLKGYDRASNQVILNSGVTENYRVRLRIFERTWTRADRWAVTTTSPDTLPATAEPDKYFQSLVDLEHSNSDFDTLYFAYQHSLEKWPTHRELLMGQGNLLLRNGLHRLAISSYRTLLVAHPKFGPAHNNLAHSLVKTGQFDAARKHALIAIQFSDQYVEIYRRTLMEISTLESSGSHQPNF
ncbi:MAG: PA2778 family cysteine peptidase [Gammaproteobacteria bacterium]